MNPYKIELLAAWPGEAPWAPTALLVGAGFEAEGVVFAVTAGEAVDKEVAIELGFALLLNGLAWAVDGGGVGGVAVFFSTVLREVKEGLGGGRGAKEGVFGAGAGAGAGAVLPKSQ